MVKDNKVCSVCGKTYTYCPTCRAYENEPRWKTFVCSENCHNIFMISTDVLADAISIKNAKAKLDKCDLSAKAKFSNGVKKAINKIATANKVTSTALDEVITPTVKYKETVKITEAKEAKLAINDNNKIEEK